MPHFHLSLQSGADLILKRMKRRHLRHHVIAFCEKLRVIRPDVVLGADIIAGFPTETGIHFDHTYRLLQEQDFSFFHVFPFSPRPGTPAARMPQVTPSLIKSRAALLRKLGEAQRIALLDRFIGQTVEVLMENPFSGHSAHFVPVNLNRPQTPGDIVRVQVERREQKTLMGRAV